jgi:hypothetical protein
MEPYEAIKLGHFDSDHDGKLTEPEKKRFEKYEKRMRAGVIDTATVSAEEREILAELWLGHVLTENLKSQEELVNKHESE